MATSDYTRKLAEGQWFQDVVAARLCREGIVLNNYQSRAFQLQHGENALGLEVKFDQQMATTGNCYIETAEKTNAVNAAFVRSGIYANARAWLYGIGNTEEFFIFSVKRLQLLDAPTAVVAWKRPRARGF